MTCLLFLCCLQTWLIMSMIVHCLRQRQKAAQATRGASNRRRRRLPFPVDAVCGEQAVANDGSRQHPRVDCCKLAKVTAAARPLTRAQPSKAASQPARARRTALHHSRLAHVPAPPQRWPACHSPTPPRVPVRATFTSPGTVVSWRLATLSALLAALGSRSPAIASASYAIY